MKLNSICQSYILTLVAMVTSLCSGVTEEETLRKFLFTTSGYDPEAMPTVPASLGRPQVSLTFYLMYLHHLREKKRVLTTYGRLKAEWIDTRLRWVPQSHGNIQKLYVSPAKIWTPELAVVNAEQHMFLDFSRFLVLVTNTGHVTWTPAGLFETHCDIDVTCYPYDYQRCTIQVGSWAMTTQDISLKTAKTEIQLEQFVEHGAWDVFGTSAREDVFFNETTTGNQHPCVTFSLVMERIHDFYSVHLVLPSIAMAILVPMIFLTPAASGEKITIGVSVVLAFSVFLLFAVDSLPESSTRLPLMGICLMLIMMVSSTALVLSIFTLNLYHRPSWRPIPERLRWFTMDFLAKIFCIPDRLSEEHTNGKGNGSKENESVSIKAKDMDPPKPMKRTVSTPHGVKVSPTLHEGEVGRVSVVGVQPLDDRKGKKAWQLVARILDRFHFCLAVLVMLGMMLALLVKVNLQVKPTP